MSKFKNSKVPSISTLQRKDLNQSKIPGPGKYETYDNTSPEGKYVSSKHCSNYSRKFTK